MVEARGGIRIPNSCSCKCAMGDHHLKRADGGWQLVCPEHGTACFYLNNQPEVNFQQFINEHPELEVHPRPRVHQWKTKLEPLPVSKLSSRTSDRNDSLARFIHPAGTKRIRPTGLRAVSKTVRRRASSVAGRFRRVSLELVKPKKFYR